MTRVYRSAEILLGVLFIAAAVLKALDMDAFFVQVRLYGVVHEPSLVRLAAWTSLTVESVLGIGLLTGIRLRGLTAVLTGVMLIGFTALIAYAWKYKGLSDCGCFGKYVQMSPGVSIAKNVVMLALAVVAGIGARRMETPSEAPNRFLRPPKSVQAVLAVACAILVGGTARWAQETPAKVVTTPATRPTANVNAAPFAQFQLEFEGRKYDLGKGDYIVAMLSASCDHCKAAVPALNAYTINPELPTLVALVHSDAGKPDEDKKELTSFRDETRPEFPTVLMYPDLTNDKLLFYGFVGNAPPRFYVIRDGKELQHWDDLTPPSAEAIMDAMNAAAATKPAS